MSGRRWVNVCVDVSGGGCGAGVACSGEPHVCWNLAPIFASGGNQALLLLTNMGNDQSRGGGPQDLKPLDYYELLQIDEEATADEIKVGRARASLTCRKRIASWRWVCFSVDLITARQSPRQESS
jgi:hypothetical protein